MFKGKQQQSKKDEELVALYAQTLDKNCVGILYERYAHLVFGVCMKYLKNREESKDAVLSIFEKLLTDLRNHKIENFKSWIHSVARNHCLMFLRKNNRPGTESDIDLLQNQLSESGKEQETEKEYQLQELEKAILQLNEEQKKCIELFYLQDQCYQDVAAQTGYSLNTVKSAIQNGKRNLKLILSKQNEKVIK